MKALPNLQGSNEYDYQWIYPFLINIESQYGRTQTQGTHTHAHEDLILIADTDDDNLFNKIKSFHYDIFLYNR